MNIVEWWIWGRPKQHGAVHFMFSPSGLAKEDLRGLSLQRLPTSKAS